MDKWHILIFPVLFVFAFLVLDKTYAQTIPLAPSNLNSVVLNYNQVNLSWVDESSNEAEFRIYRRTAYTGSWSQIVSLASGSHSYSDKDILLGSYEYDINACNQYGCSAYSNITTATITPDTIPPTAPGSFTAMNKVVNNQADLAWSASTDNTGLKYYKIYRSVHSTTNFSFLASVSYSQLSYSDKALAPTTYYYYLVKSVDVAGNESAPSGIGYVVTGSVDSSGNYIRLTYPNGGECFVLPSNLPIRWTGVGINQIAIYITSHNNNRVFLGNATSFDWYMNASVSYTTNGAVKIVAVDGNGVEGISDTNDGPFSISKDCSVTTNPNSIPSTPSRFVAALVEDERDVALSWQDNSSNEANFNIYRRVYPNGTWQFLTTLGANTISYTDRGVAPGTYEYDANSCNQVGCSGYSNQFIITAHATAVSTEKIYSASELTSGDMISAGSGDPDIYIANEHGYKRLFLNPIIFSFYGHLGGFTNVKRVSSATRDAYTTSGLFRNCETGEGNVYGVEITGEDAATLHWVNTTAETALVDDPNFFKKVFCINNNEFNWYQKGVDYTSINQIPSYSR